MNHSEASVLIPIAVRLSVRPGPILRQKPSMKMKQALIVLALIPLMTSGCLLLSGRCIYELRGVVATGQFIQAVGDTVSAEVNIGEQRDSDPNKTMSWIIRGPAIKGRVQSIKLVDETNPTVALYTFPVSVSEFPALSNGAVSQNEGANLNGLFDVLAGSRGIIVITTDIPGRATIQFRLNVTSESDWNRPYCS